ncbi:9361_t:CDS:1, partial [Gigaspora rosea]
MPAENFERDATKRMTVPETTIPVKEYTSKQQRRQDPRETKKARD